MDRNCVNAFSRYFKWQKTNGTYFGAGSPSASHSMMNGFSVSPYDATWNNISSAIGCLMIRGGEWTTEGERRMKWLINASSFCVFTAERSATLGDLYAVMNEIINYRDQDSPSASVASANATTNIVLSRHILFNVSSS